MNTTVNTAHSSFQSTTQRRSSVTLTSRGKVVLGLTLTLIALFVWVLFGSGTADAAGSSQGPATGIVVVQPGENLWSIAQSVDPQGDPRDLVIRIREMNALGSQHVFPGQSLVVPVS
jgi:LysM repeat protein